MLNFTGNLVDSDGQEVRVQCKLKYPLSKESPTEIKIYALSHIRGRLENPCQITANGMRSTLTIKDLWYSAYTMSIAGEDFYYDQITPNHIDSLEVKVNKSNKNKCLRFHLSHANFLKNQHASKRIQYSKNPNQSVNIFNINIDGLGTVNFFKEWNIVYKSDEQPSAEIYDDYVAELDLKESELDYLKAYEIFKESLFAISVLFRQAVSIVRWEYRDEGQTTIFISSPLSPHIPPYIHGEQDFPLTIEKEFEGAAESLVNGYLSLSPKLKKRFKELSISLAPNLVKSSEQRFVSMYSAFERTVGLMKLPKSEKEKFDKSNSAVIIELEKTVNSLDQNLGDLLDNVRTRLQGFIRTVKSGELSFVAKLELMREQYPASKVYERDLWPIDGTESTLSIRAIRHKLTHSSVGSVNHQVVAVAEWHFSIYLERLLFVLCGKTIPKGIGINSIYLNTGWYYSSYWIPLTKSEEQ
jgi:hypothetical protein